MKQSIWRKPLPLYVLPALILLGILFLSPSKAFAVTNGKITYMHAGEVWVMDADGSNKTKLTNDGSSAYPSFAPDGSKITYTRFTGETYLFSTINSDGTSNNITDFNGLYTRWLPNSTKVAPYSFDAGAVVVMNPDGTEIQNTGYAPFFENGLAFAYDFSPDSTRFVYPVQDGGGSKIQISDLDGSNSSVISTLFAGAAPNFSADGNTVYFLGSEDAEVWSLYSVGVDGLNQTELHSLPVGGTPEVLSISTDRTKLLFAKQGDTDETADIYTMNIDGSNQVELFDEASNSVVSGMGWSPDGAKLVFTQTVDSGGDIFTINADGTGLTNLTNTSDEEEFTFLGQSWGAAPESSGDSGTDTDGISDSVENAGPNSGDANNDGTPDSEQSNVASFVDSVTGEYAVLEVSEDCSVTSVSIDEESTAQADRDFSYPMGLMDFTLDCGTPGFTADITQYYYRQDSSDFVVRKYNPTTKTYATIDQAELSNLTIDSNDVVKATYQVTDGGELDLDNTTDGNIHDPAGLAQTTGSLADTGQNTQPIVLLATILLTSGLAVTTYTYNKRRKHNA